MGLPGTLEPFSELEIREVKRVQLLILQYKFLSIIKRTGTLFFLNISWR